MPLFVMVKGDTGVVSWRKGPQGKTRGAIPKVDISLRARLTVGASPGVY